MPAADPSVSAELGRAFRAQGINVHTGTLVEELRPRGDAIRVGYRNGAVAGQLVAGAVFFAVAGLPTSITSPWTPLERVPSRP